MNICKWCSESAHPAITQCDRVAYPEIEGCVCGCHQVTILEKYDKETWWLPSDDPIKMGLQLSIREKPFPGFVLIQYYREPSPLGELGAWVEGDEVKIQPKQLHDLKEIGAVKEV